MQLSELRYAIGSFADLIPLTALAVILVLAGIVYIKFFYGMHDWFKKLPIKPHFKPAIGAGLAGLVAWALFALSGEQPETLSVLSTGYGSIH